VKPYTVIVMYPAYLWPRPGDPINGIAWVRAASPEQAAHAGSRRIAWGRQPPGRIVDFPPIAVFAGHHDDINPAMRRGRSERRNG